MYNFQVNLPLASGVGISFIAALVCYKIFKKSRKAADAFNYLTIDVVEDVEHCDKIVIKLLEKSKQHNAIGFDCEWVTEGGKRQPISLIQLSTYDGHCGLFRISKMKHVPELLKALLENENIYKLGVAPVDDAKYLVMDYGVYMKSTLDIRHIVQLCGYEATGLGALSESLLGVILDKSWRIRCSDWSADILSDRQINYAAADAYVAIKIFIKLINELYSSPFSWFKSDKFTANIHLDLCWKYSDICYKTKSKLNSKVNGKVKERKHKDINDKLVFKKKYTHTTRSKPLYHNCYLQAPDGELLCTCDDKKAMWYVQKELADVIQESPLTVRLRFEPSGRSVGEVGRYYQLVKENKCVVCGEGNSYIRKNVVPKEYRKYFPELMKDHSSHDVLLLCLTCHQRSNMLDQAVRERLTRLCDASSPEPDLKRYTEDSDCKKIRSASRALLSRKNVLPEERRRHLEELLLSHYPQHDKVTEELLQEAANLSVIVENMDFEAHGCKVVEHFTQGEGLLRLEQLWREHFLDSMRPRYLPELWSINHNEERMRVRLSEGRLSEEDMKMIGMTV